MGFPIADRFDHGSAHDERRFLLDGQSDHVPTDGRPSDPLVERRRVF